MLRKASRIGVVAAAALLAVVGSGASAAEMTPHEASLYEAAKSERELTWYVAQFGGEPAERTAQAFAAKYPGVQVNVVRTTGQVAFARLMQDIRANTAQCDVFSGTDIGHAVSLKEQNQLMQYVPENAAKVIEAYKDADPDGYYHTTNVNLFILIYNTERVTEAEAPKSWADLVDARWADQISTGHPGFSGTVGSWVVLMRKLYGWEYFEKMEALNPLVGRSGNDPVSILNSGERGVGTAPISTAARSKAQGNPIGLVYPADGAMRQINVSAILANSPHPNAAKLFMEFLLSIEQSELVAEQFYEPLRPEVAPPPGMLPATEVKSLALTVPEMVEGIPEVIVEWRDTFGN